MPFKENQIAWISLAVLLLFVGRGGQGPHPCSASTEEHVAAWEHEVAASTARLRTWKEGRHAVSQHRKQQRQRRALREHPGEQNPDELGVTEIPLPISFKDSEAAIVDLLEPLLGVELDYWRSKKLSCRELSETIIQKHRSQWDNVKAVLVRNNTWYFVHPDMPPFGNGTLNPIITGGDGSPGATQQRWPDLVVSPLGSCINCHPYMNKLHREVTHIMGQEHERYRMPDTLFVLNTADNMNRHGKGMPAPLLSIQKWWRVPWWQENAQLALGRINGRLLNGTAFGSVEGSDWQPMGPLGLRAAHAAWRRQAVRPGAGWQEVLGQMMQRPIHIPPSLTDAAQPEWDWDLLVPQATDVPSALLMMPWEQKVDKAFFSGSPYCPQYANTHNICQRCYMAVLSLFYPKDLEVRMTQPWYHMVSAGAPFHKVFFNITHWPHASPKAHARFRWLPSFEGMTHSFRMGFIMATNSVMLKSRSSFIEWFSRLLVPGAHHLEFWKDPQDPNDILAVLAQARAAQQADMEGLRAAVEANQKIAARYLGMLPRLLYFRAVVHAYTGLFSDMPQCVADLVAHLERRSGRRLEDTPHAQPER